MVEILFDEEFRRQFSKLDNVLKKKIIRQLQKIKDSPSAGKPMMYARKGTREVYVKPYRLSYSFEKEKIIILALYHKDEQ